MNSWDFSMHQAGTSVCAAGSSASTDTTWPTGTSLIRSASMMIGLGHLRPRPSIISVGVGGAAGVSAGGCGGVPRITSRSGLRAVRGSVRRVAALTVSRSRACLGAQARQEPILAGVPGGAAELRDTVFHDRLEDEQ